MNSATKDLYFLRELGTLPLGVVAAPAQCAGVAQSLERMARAVRGVLHARGATRRVSPLPARTAERQPPQSMSAMLERVRDPGTYQAFQHFITDAPSSYAKTPPTSHHGKQSRIEQAGTAG